MGFISRMFFSRASVFFFPWGIKIQTALRNGLFRSAKQTVSGCDIEHIRA